VALEWQAQGATRLHIVDLDGAASGQVQNLEVIDTITSAVLIPTELGGGIRTMETIETLLKIGIDRVILGTVAVESPQLVQDACRKFADAVIVSIDSRQGKVATRGWLEGTHIEAIEFGRKMVRLGVKRFIYTDITRDGTLTEPNFTAITDFMDAVKTPVIAAGGISTVTHLKILKKLGLEGAIVGKALYTGDIDLKQALAAAG
jgi:phosphoribosylformimino-5-aminoimidazole carboxamide ribotide isomerase